jgi:Fe-S cluster assembly ATP-binding protein
MTDLLEIKDLYVSVDGQELLHGIDLTIPDGEVHALLGPNGSGKTSLMMAVMGFSEYRITQGQIRFDGQDITEMDVTERARLGIGMAQQRPPTISGVRLHHVLDYVAAREPEHAAEVEALVEDARMESFLDRDINAGLSGGEIKRSELLQLLATHPRFGMMDEPDSGVDLVALELVGAMVNRLFSVNSAHPARRRAGLIITHTGQILDYVYADKAHVMLDGRLACSGNPGLIMDTIARGGYEQCARCMGKEM